MIILFPFSKLRSFFFSILHFISIWIWTQPEKCHPSNLPSVISKEKPFPMIPLSSSILFAHFSFFHLYRVGIWASSGSHIGSHSPAVHSISSLNFCKYIWIAFVCCEDDRRETQLLCHHPLYTHEPRASAIHILTSISKSVPNIDRRKKLAG